MKGIIARRDPLPSAPSVVPLDSVRFEEMFWFG